MRTLRTYALALALCITSVGALSSNDISEGGLVNLRHYGDAIISAAEQSLHYVSATIGSTFANVESASNGSKRANSSAGPHDDTDLIGTLIVVTVIAGFAIIRRLD